MMNVVTLSLKDSLRVLQQTARSPLAIKEWLQLHPDALPTPPVAFPEPVRISFDQPPKVIHTEHTFSMALHIRYEAGYQTEQTAGLQSVAGDAVSPVMVTVNAGGALLWTLDACEWPFVCVDALCSHYLDRMFSHKKAIRVLEIVTNQCLPQLGWNNYMRLLTQRSLPNTRDGLRDALFDLGVAPTAEATLRTQYGAG